MTETQSPLPAQSLSEADLRVLLAMWKDAYLAFQGAFDTPLARRRDNSEFAEDARKRLRDFHETLSKATGQIPLAGPADLFGENVAVGLLPINVLDQGTARSIPEHDPFELTPGHGFENWKAEAIALIKRRQMVQAVKLCRSALGIGLREAKDHCDRLVAEIDAGRH